jgi:signal transduction histidine kinase/DNA-binding NarL/FixJ family response regulator
MSGSEAELKQSLRDVLGLLALPAIWRGRSVAQILQSFGEALEATLDVQVLLAVAKAGDEPACVCRVAGQTLAAPQPVQSWFAPFHGRSSAIARVPCGALGELTAVVEPLAYGGAEGYVVVASSTPGFPSARDLVALKTAASLVTNALETAQAFREREAALRAKDDFLAVLGHELRNPLAPIATALDVMDLRNGSAASREEQVMRRQIEYLRRLVDDLMDISKINRSALTLERALHELSAIVADAVEATAEIYATKRHVLTVTVPERGLVVHGDRIRLVQAIGNLLINAAKYTPPGGHMSLEARVTEGTSIQLSLTDDGIGMAAELMPRIFEKFVQGERHANRQHGGLGVGLALVRTLIEMHGGEVSARSDGPGRGSTFVIQLPLSPGSVQPAPEAIPSSPPSQVVTRAKRVLIVDDNLDAAEMLAEALGLAGCECQIEQSSTSAVAALEAFGPDICLLDIGMPDLDGYALCALIRARASTRELPLIALTGYGQPADRERATAAGFNAHCTKPVRLSALIELIDSLVSAGLRTKASPFTGGANRSRYGESKPADHADSPAADSSAG